MFQCCHRKTVMIMTRFLSRLPYWCKDTLYDTPIEYSFFTCRMWRKWKKERSQMKGGGGESQQSHQYISATPWLVEKTERSKRWRRRVHTQWERLQFFCPKVQTTSLSIGTSWYALSFWRYATRRESRIVRESLPLTKVHSHHCGKQFSFTSRFT